MNEQLPEPDPSSHPWPDDTPEQQPARVPVVGIGASAGGLEALREFLASTPADTGACFVFVQHLDPDHKSMLTELLTRCTEMPVLPAGDRMTVEPNRVVVIPPDSTLTIRDGALHLTRPAPPRLHRTPIDSFFHSLAADQGERAMAIVLSGTGSDGTQGLKAVKEAGGFTLAQEPSSAKYDSMPRNAEATGLVDQVLPVQDMPACLIDHLASMREDAQPGLDSDRHRHLRDSLAKIGGLLKITTGHDFRDYKEPTVTRRVQRRMQVLKIAEIDDYVQRLREDKKEVKQLFRELLVSVTGFFRDPGAYEALSQRVVDKLLEDKEAGETVRVWVPGCATGEEAYSLAMILRDRVDRSEKPLRLQIFATDIDDAALEVARRGIYPDSIAAYVPEALLKRFFRVRGNEYQVTEEIREICIFSIQSLIKDPPFSRLDLLSCRNVLIYLKPELQSRLIPVFHYALRPNGFLFLGTSENVTRHQELFEAVDAKWRIFRRRETGDRPVVQFPLMELRADGDGRRRSAQPEGGAGQRAPVVAAAEAAILNELGPTFAVVNEQRELVYSGGRLDPFLSLRPGAPLLEITAIVHEGLRMDVRALLHRAMADQVETVRDQVTIAVGERRRRVALLCRPLAETDDKTHHYLLVFRDLGAQLDREDQPPANDEGQAQVLALENELRTTKEYLQTTTEELESSNEELKSANEELMSMNEELQSSNEELETSKEELQSVNEELETVNAELSSKVDELARANGDLENLLESTQIATLFLDRSGRVRRFTPLAKDIFNLIDGDLGRSIADITPRIDAIDLASEVRGVLDRLAPVEREVRLREGGTAFLMRLMPYRTPGDVIDGVVATFVDIAGLKDAQNRIDTLNAELQAQLTDVEALLDLAPIGIAFADDPECRNITVNRYGGRIMKIPRQTKPAGDPGARYRFVRNGKEVPAEELPLQKAWRTGKPVRDFRAAYVAEDESQFEFLMSSTPVLDESGAVRRVIGVYDDVTRLVEAQTASEVRAAQQDFVAKTGSLSLRGHSAEAVMAQLPEELAHILSVDYAKILIHRPETNDFRLAASYGFKVPEGAAVPGGLDSQAGYTLQSAGPVIVENLAEDRRFRGPPLLRDSGVVSGVSVVIGDPGRPWGVLGVHTRRRRAFSADDVKFLQSIANVVAATLERDAWAGRQGLLLDELRHRVKNSLATVQAIASLSLRGQPVNRERIESFFNRLRALSSAHELHFRHDWRHVDLRELVRCQVEPFDESGDRVLLRGPAGVSLPPNAAIDMAMVLHELVTNAVKHGALAEPNGRVETGWDVDAEEGRGAVVFQWSERCRRRIEPPRHEGLGTRFLKAIASRPELTVERDFADHGLQCRIEIRTND